MSKYSKLEFYINGGDVGGQQLEIYVNDKHGNGKKKAVMRESLAPREWKFVSIPLEALEAVDTIIVKVNIANVSRDSAPQFFLNDLSLVS